MSAARKALSNISIYAGLLGAGDVICQQLEKEAEKLRGDSTVDKWDPKRTAILLAGGVPTGIWAHVWYGYLDRRFPGTSAGTILKKVLADQTIFTPIFYLTFFTSKL